MTHKNDHKPHTHTHIHIYADNKGGFALSTAGFGSDENDADELNFDPALLLQVATQLTVLAARIRTRRDG